MARGLGCGWHVWTESCGFIEAKVCMYVYVHVCVCTCMYVYVHACMCMSMYVVGMFGPKAADLLMPKYVCMCMYIYVHVHACMCMYRYVIGMFGPKAADLFRPNLYKYMYI